MEPNSKSHKILSTGVAVTSTELWLCVRAPGYHCLAQLSAGGPRTELSAAVYILPAVLET